MSSTPSPPTSSAAASPAEAGLPARLGAYALVAGSGFYLTQVMSLSPAYPLVGAAAVLALLAAIGGAPAHTRPLAPWVTLAILVVHLFAYQLRVAPEKGALGYAMNLVALPLAALLFPQLRTRELFACRQVLCWTTLGLGALEAGIRWLFPVTELAPDRAAYIAESGAAFYEFKFNSIMYMDSNFVGMWLLTVFLFHLESAPRSAPRGAERAQSAALYALLCLSLCRAAILAATAYLVLRWLWRSPRRPSRGVILGGCAVVALGIAAFFASMAGDESFQSKLLILDLATSGVLRALDPEKLLFGWGVTTSADVLGGIAAHNWVLMTFIECGVVGLACTVLLHAFYARRAPATRGMMLCFHLAGLSMAPLVAPYLYVALQLGLELARRDVPLAA